MRKQALGNFIGSPRNLVGTKPTPGEQTAHGESVGSLRVSHTKAWVAKKQAFLVAKARDEELRAVEAEGWRGPSSSARHRTRGCRVFR